MDDRRAAHPRRADLHVRDLCRHADDEREIEEVEHAGLLFARSMRSRANQRIEQTLIAEARLASDLLSSNTGLPASAPDAPVTTLVLECDDVPVQDTDYVRINKPRAGIGM